MGSNRALFLDRDGTINVDRPYISSPSDLVLIPGVAEAIARAQAAHYKIIVVSNQSGVGRGIIKEKALEEIHRTMDSLLWEAAKAKVDYYSICIHHPQEACECRKPKTKLILDVARNLSIDLGKSFFVGDRHTDICAGINSGCRSILVCSGKGIATKKSYKENAEKFKGELPVFIARDLSVAIDWILSTHS